ncbi:hypothetical protein [Methanolobus sp.]|uniref:helix-turn-helix transcriptional regulator n=1 Tax=Methanolobus sp. TaxID=1874737 RepID=UPI0025FA3B98|nr:hypothetical protein [Methanolobus sp.]
MKFILYISCVAVLLLMPGLCMASGVATVHGVAYEWSTFEPLDNTLVEVNSTPVQSMVAKSGVYSFDLPSGTYLIKAKYYQNDALTHYGEEVITVSDEGSYVVDMLLLPSYTNTGLDAVVLSPENTGQDTAVLSSGDSSGILIGASLSLILVLLILFYQVRYKSERSPAVSHTRVTNSLTADPFLLEPDVFEPVKTEYPTAPLIKADHEIPETQLQIVYSQEEDGVSDMAPGHILIPELNLSDGKAIELSFEPVPADLQEILDILRSQGGRITQKDMRKRLRYSEGKVSLMLLDLEKRGKIQKFKKGRGNILFLVEGES